ncbi:hypothetical protein CLOSTMETH_00363 [[Clostridium] methylpentosum DSM 5476]|uniref:Uncharacterized protein n=1 Tax=[Clostridium] methylpentosum DSM 5476 TaxID=537013 RepID=C0E965_9FIRM|nr:hypothetical protein CLOSTMETH_00363 [[Clostridium] methylpentosum DSM 5476]
MIPNLASSIRRCDSQAVAHGSTNRFFLEPVYPLCLQGQCALLIMK